MGITWREKRTNESVSQEIGELRGDMTLNQRATRQKLMYLGHVMHADGLEKALIWCVGRVEEKRTTKDQMDGGGAEENSNESCTAERGDNGQESVEKTGHDFL